MTLQISTPIHYLDDRFEILDSDNILLFNPKKLNIECMVPNTSNWKGYKCEYAIKDKELYLINFTMHGNKKNQDLALLNFLTKKSLKFLQKNHFNFPYWLVFLPKFTKFLVLSPTFSSNFIKKLQKYLICR